MTFRNKIPVAITSFFVCSRMTGLSLVCTYMLLVKAFENQYFYAVFTEVVKFSGCFNQNL